MSSTAAVAEKAAPVEKFRKDYTPYPYAIESVRLEFDVREGETLVTSRLSFAQAAGTAAGTPLELNGEALTLRSVSIGDATLAAGTDYEVTEEGMTLLRPPAGAFTLVSTVSIAPEKNTALSGLYQSSGNLCTQCEAEGFRRITYFPDRPDVMSSYSVRVEADKAKFPVLLSNGNEVGRGDAPDGRHWAEFIDPFRKPSYLFALVAGDLGGIESSFTTMSGREVRLALWSERENLDQLDWAMQSLKDSMKWDEDTYGREYDLDVYHIVAVNDFNMGAMENKGLNVFNTACVLAKPSTATDGDYESVQRIVAHEYFHNWSGNRVTCRDWFQLTLKEGLTVFRDQHFSSDMRSSAVKRIEDVRIMRSAQFLQDSGPMAHPIRPESYIAMDNFYTVTVYNKGAEVIRMYRTLLGADAFRKGMDLYFDRHDGQAVTCDEFRAALSDANGASDLLGEQFERWYTQAGTPTVTATGAYDAAKKVYSLTLTQITKPTPGQSTKEPFLIPVAAGLMLRDGSAWAGGETRVLTLREPTQTFTFENVPSDPVPSLLRGFSAPVRLVVERTDEELTLLASADPDPFNRWDASQQLATRVLLGLVKAGGEGAVPPTLIEAYRATLADATIEPALAAYAIGLPDYGSLSLEFEVVDPAALTKALKTARAAIAAALRPELLVAYARLAPPPGEGFNVEPETVGKRRFRNTCLAYLTNGGAAADLALALGQFKSATCMSDSLAAVNALAPHMGPVRDEALGAFYSRAAANKEELVINKWFAVQAAADSDDTLATVRSLLAHPAYNDNPNRVRALVSTFCGNAAAFHKADGSGYNFVAEQVLALDKKNPNLAARLAGSFGQWRRYTPAQSVLMQSALQRIKGTPGLSKDTFEIASRSLA